MGLVTSPATVLTEQQGRLRQLCADHLESGGAALIERLARPAIRLRHSDEPTRSHLGRPALLPHGAQWPRWGAKPRGFTYTGPVYAIKRLIGELCPWCIADGSAAAAFEAEFTDVGWGVPEGVPNDVVQQVAKRTPGFRGWQQERWLFHCDDAAAFLGRAGYEQLRELESALEMLRAEHIGVGWTDEQIDGYLRSLHAEGDATAYLVRCLPCGRHLTYSDSS
jgi:uncharacterized protein